MDTVACKCAGVILILIQAATSRVSDPKIVGGEDARIQDFPYQVSIRLTGSHYCGGSILNRQTILTAGHCAQQPQMLYTVHVGSNDLQSITVPHMVRRKIVHENYHVADNGAPVNDIALFKIFPPIIYSGSQKAVKLPRQGQNTPAGCMAIATGWGATHEGGGSSRILQKVSLPIVALDTCKRLYEQQLPAHQICAGYPETGGKDSCQGDSGGPLVAGGVQVGVVSWGYGCAQPNFPGVYTEVAAYRSWISKKVGM